MLSLLLRTFSSVCVATVTLHVATAVATETIVGVVGRKVALPCRLEAATQKAADVCWGRGEPSLFTCQNAVVHAVAGLVSYRKSYRFSVSSSSSSSSLHILNARPSDSGFYHCRVQLPGLFNDQTSTVHLIIISPRSAGPGPSSEPSSKHSGSREAGNLNAPQSTAGCSTEDTTQTGSDVNTRPTAVQVKSSFQRQQLKSLELFMGNTVRLSLIIFIPALLLTVAYRVWRSDAGRRSTQSEDLEEEQLHVDTTDRSQR